MLKPGTISPTPKHGGALNRCRRDVRGAGREGPTVRLRDRIAECTGHAVRAVVILIRFRRLNSAHGLAPAQESQSGPTAVTNLSLSLLFHRSGIRDRPTMVVGTLYQTPYYRRSPAPQGDGRLR